MERRIIALMLAFLLLLTGCSQVQMNNQSFTIAQGVDATTLDPHMHNETPSANVTRHIFDSLLTRDINMELVPQLAESIQMLDPLTWEVILREGIRFHNGEVFDAQAAKFSIVRLVDPQQGSPQLPSVSMIEAVEVMGDYKIHVITKNPYPLLPSRLTMAMVPPGYISEVGNEVFSERPVGTGPYIFEHWKKDEEVVLVRNDDYWMGKTAFEEVIFKVIPESSVRIAELMSGQVDLIGNIPPHQVSVLENNEHIKILTVPSGRIIFIQWVTDSDSPIADPRVREAIQYAVDMETIVETIFEGYAKRISQPLTVNDFGHHPEIEMQKHDPMKARERLAEAGYENGISLVLDGPMGRYSLDKEVMQAIQGQLEAVGIEVTVNFNEWGVHVGKILDRKMENGYLIGWGSSLFDADATLYPNFHSSSRISFFANQKVDQLLDRARETMDPVARLECYHEALEIITAEAAVLALYQPEDMYAMRRHIQWQPRADEMIDVRDMKLIK